MTDDHHLFYCKGGQRRVKECPRRDWSFLGGDQMSAGIRQSVRHPRISDSEVVVVDVSSWIVEAFFLFNILACLALFLLGYFWHVWRCYYWAYFLLD